MLQLVTANRKGYKTKLKWLCLNNNTIVNAITTEGDEVFIESLSDLDSQYEPRPEPTLFKGYSFLSEKKKQHMSKKQPQTKPQNIKRPPAPSGITPKPNNQEVSPAYKNINVSSVTFSNTVEETFVLQMFNGNNLIFEMEFEKEEDFNYRHMKLAEQYPTYRFCKKTLRSIVSYEQL